MEHNIISIISIVKGSLSYIPYSADPENHTLALSRSYSYTVRSDLTFAVGYQSAPEGDWGNVSVNTPIRMVLP